jgi:chitin disaccharide deacetylase
MRLAMPWLDRIVRKIMTEGKDAAAKLVVTADDFGISPAVDRGILEAFHRGIVRSTALLVNFPDVYDSVARLRHEPGLEVGIHLNLTAGPPVLPPERVPSLVRADGNFHGFTAFFARVALSQIDWHEVAMEWEAQFERGIELGCAFTFITSHQHVHMLPALARISAKLAHEFEVRAVRLSNFRVSEMLWPLRLKGLALSTFAATAADIFKRSNVFSNASILEIPPGTPDRTVQQLCGIIKRLDSGVHELVCHPGYVDSLLETRDTYVAARPGELSVLTDAKLATFLQTAGIERTTFHELAGYSNRTAKAYAHRRTLEESFRPVISSP